MLGQALLKIVGGATHSDLGLDLNCNRYGIPWLTLSLNFIHSSVLPEHLTDQ